MHVHDGPTGETTLTVAALRRAIDAKLSPLGVRLIGVQVTDKEVLITVEASGDPIPLRAVVEDRLDYGFWIDLGLADLTPRVRLLPSKRRRG